MKKNFKPVELAACIKKHREELFSEIEKTLVKDKQILRSYRKKQLKASLDQFLNNVGRVLKDGTNFQVNVPSKRVDPFDKPREEIYFHFLSEKLFVNALRTLIHVTEEEWLGIRHTLVRVFHNVLRPGVSSKCASCRCAMEEDLAKSRRMETNLKALFNK